jgi:alpha-N-arabinofuranosidase
MSQICKYAAFALAFGIAVSATAQTNLPLYTDSLANGFQDWSWGTHDLNSTSTVHSGTNAISFSGTTWNAISIWHSDFNPAPYTNLTFWANGGSGGGQILQVYLQFGTNTGPACQLSALTANAWRQFVIPFSTLGAVGVTNLNRINLQLTSSGTANAFYLDDINLMAIAPAPVHLTVNAGQTLRTADARWFGLNTAVWDGYFDTTTTSDAMAELGTRILRFPGGSLSDEYHWVTGTSLSNTWAWATSFDNFRHIATNGGLQAIITVNYGTGTSNEAAAWVKCANVTNHLGFKYWEIGNECYGTWETDSNTCPHDPYTYAVRAANYLRLMKPPTPTSRSASSRRRARTLIPTNSDAFRRQSAHRHHELWLDPHHAFDLEITRGDAGLPHASRLCRVRLGQRPDPAARHGQLGKRRRGPAPADQRLPWRRRHQH